METITLEAKNKTEERVLAYLVENASSVLAEKINAGTKTLAGALKHAAEQARELVEDGATSACVDDETVFGWIIHFFECDDLKEPVQAKTSARLPGGITPVSKPKPEKKRKPEPSEGEELPLFASLFLEEQK